MTAGTVTARSVLLVEDDALIRLDAEEILTSEGFEVLAVDSGKQAVAELDTDGGRFDAVVTDIRLGDGPSGWDVGRHARELVATIPVIYMTADSAKAWSSQGVPNSVLLQKPFVPAQLITALSTLLNQNATNNLG
ncbi:response regulator [Rhizobium deserti]|uniref:Response regulator n=1 Tax=Rhizobium deserti TaxID=2547961 RepID=A0A4R5UJT8_9HYPH|nr:response regulator [Rhizobium deserti]TDK37141.1 response regulator [Rhizobium deserti]